ncbi:MAG: CPBP family intramembrane metalloprotease [Saprospiraceae bacterium]|nr:CPBP family intramembrane metalloprotease [Candidatus Vicinibacter affinis]
MNTFATTKITTKDNMFLENARNGNNAGWVYFLTILLCFLAATLSAFLIAEYTYIDPLERNKTLVSLLLPFCFILAELIFCVSYLHRRPILSLFTAFKKLRLQRIFFSFFVWFCLMGIAELVASFVFKLEYQFKFDFSAFLILVSISFSLLLIQSLTEELFFRGYVMQGLYLLFSNKYLPVIVSAVFFAFMHGGNPENEQFGYGLMFGYYFISAVFLGFITVVDQGLEQAIGIHAATNIYGAVIVGYQGAILQTDCLLMTKDPDGKIMVLLSLFIMAAYFFISRYYLKFLPIKYLFSKNKINVLE